MIRTENEFIIKTAPHWTPEGKSSNGRPKNTWRRLTEANIGMVRMQELFLGVGDTSPPLFAHSLPKGTTRNGSSLRDALQHQNADDVQIKRV